MGATIIMAVVVVITEIKTLVEWEIITAEIIVTNLTSGEEVNTTEEKTEDRVDIASMMKEKEVVIDRVTTIKEVSSSLKMVDSGIIGRVETVISRDKLSQAHPMTQIMMHHTSSIRKEL